MTQSPVPGAHAALGEGGRAGDKSPGLTLREMGENRSQKPVLTQLCWQCPVPGHRSVV